MATIVSIIRAILVSTKIYPLLFDVVPRNRIFDAETRNRIFNAVARNRIFDAVTRDRIFIRDAN